MGYYFWVIVLFLSFIFFGCDTHEFWLFDEVLRVSSAEDVIFSESTSGMTQSNFVRYSVDYRVSNKSDSASFLVVSGHSFVNEIPRSSGKSVVVLQAGETLDGRLSSRELEYGNRIHLRLECCSHSRCLPGEAYCPDIDIDVEGFDFAQAYREMSLYCYRSCDDVSECHSRCPSADCKKYCENADEDERVGCLQMWCGLSGRGKSCAVCEGSGCDECVSSEMCLEQCTRQSLSCMGNCSVLAQQCLSYYDIKHDSQIPCHLCGGTGLCERSSSLDETPSLHGLDGAAYQCSLDCERIPTSCYDGCVSIFSEVSERIGCVRSCLEQHSYWCSGGWVSDDYTDPQSSQPCCYAGSCDGELYGVVRTEPVECFSDIVCGSGRVCNRQGVCEVVSDTGSCSALSFRVSGSRGVLPFLVFVVLCFSYRRFRMSLGPAGCLL